MLGIATKLSQINQNALIELNNKVYKCFDYHVIDAEKTPLTNENILENLRNVVLTVQSRRKDVFELLDFYTSYDFDICIVLGNRHYLSDEEKKYKRFGILEVINKCLKIKDNLWIGTEGVEDIVQQIIEDNDLIAFHLYGCECNINAKKAIYVPFASEINKDVLKSMENYLKRRKNYNGNWQDYLISLKDIKKDFIKNIKSKNDIIVGYPIKPHVHEIMHFKEVFGG
ncbi:hypothetical protein [Methanotorris igneus]|uniref:Uncharacterized protein n=1 Tax=Methanotorris igneus (strain DSM 5666 / JCM 11834 / Kol 5) TaxID=880724 RepID=F6BAN9_METIK|nr:hypothetical protein [Methanotorris igneus]AEF95853.1 hypothetical protein Metig_0297 [Methanotorris igneus Kol 5]